jgi:hypothetical protein
MGGRIRPKSRCRTISIFSRGFAIAVDHNFRTRRCHQSCYLANCLPPKLPSLSCFALKFQFSTTPKCDYTALVSGCSNLLRIVSQTVEDLHIDYYVLRTAMADIPGLRFPGVKRLCTDYDMKWNKIKGFAERKRVGSRNENFPSVQHYENYTQWGNVLTRTRGTIESVMIAQPDFAEVRAVEIIKTFKIIAALPSRLISLSLQDIQLPDDDLNSVEIISALFGCKELEELDISGNTNPVNLISDARLKDMALAWPSLIRLAIQSIQTSNSPQISIISIVALMEHCADLQSISLSLEVVNSEVPDSLVRAGKGLYRLEELNLGRSTIDAPGRLALWLRDLCSADHITWEAIDDDDWRNGIFEGLESTVRELQKWPNVVDQELQEQVVSLQEEVESLRAMIEEMQNSGIIDASAQSTRRSVSRSSISYPLLLHD